MDQFAMGINFQVPARTVQPKRAELNDYVGRLSYLLEQGRHVADVAVLYPIASLHAAYHNAGGVDIPAGRRRAGSADHGDGLRPRGRLRASGHRLPGPSARRSSAASRVDYTYLHPEVLVEPVHHRPADKLILNNRENREEYSVLIVPAGDALSAAAAAKIKEFYDQGGTVIATAQLPTKSAEFGKDKEVRQAIADVFGVSPDAPLKADVRRAQDRLNFYVFWYYIKKNKAGGTGYLPADSPPLAAGLCSEAGASRPRCGYSGAYGRCSVRRRTMTAL